MVLGIIFILGYIAIDNSHAKDDEKTRADKQEERAEGLQSSLDILQGKSDENRKFFDLVRQLIAAQTEQERAVLREQLRRFVFTTTTTTTTTLTSSPKVSFTTTTTSGSTGATQTTTTTVKFTSTTTSSTTSTTQPTTSSLPVQICIKNPIKNICTLS